MSAPRFYVGADGGRVGTVGTTLALPDGAAHHALRALRLAVGDAVTLFDGHGGEWAGTLAHADRHGAQVHVERFVAIERELAVAVTLALGIIASDPMDSAVRKAVELGAAVIAPITCARTQGTLRGEKAARRLAHWQQIAVAACEQCGRNRVPVVAPVQDFAAWCAAHANAAAILAPGATLSLSAWAHALKPATLPHGVALATGPEGGYTDAELALAAARGITAVSLGARVLRAETAAAAALATFAAVAGDAR